MSLIDLLKIEQFFHDIAPRLLNVAESQFHNVHQLTQKGENSELSDFATETDVALEELIVGEIQKVFHGDAILSEEKYAKTSVEADGRLWIIDPLCGTTSFAKSINFYCTNIALAHNGQLVASCVVDHSQKRYIWSIGDQTVSIGHHVTSTKKTTTGTVIDIDLPAVFKGSRDIKVLHAEFVRRLLLETSYMPISHASSLGFAYAALGSIDAYVVHPTHPWDQSAAVFLLSQASGVVSQTDGEPWSLKSDSVLAARTPELHAELLKLLTESR